MICIIYASYDYSNRLNLESYLDPTSLAVCKNYLAKTNELKVKKNLESMQHSSQMRDKDMLKKADLYLLARKELFKENG